MYDRPISYSGMSLWKQCPKRWHDSYILGNRGPSGAAADRGTYLHNLLEKFFKGEAPYPSGNPVLAKWQDYMEDLVQHSPVAEGEVAVRNDWTPCGFDDDEAYFRGKKDLHYEDGSTIYLYDWKSGKIYEDHKMQGEAYSALSTGYDNYVVRFAYLDNPHIVSEWRYTKDDVLGFREEITETVEIIRQAEEYPAIPGDHCAWCVLSWRRGGECKRAR